MRKLALILTLLVVPSCLFAQSPADDDWRRRGDDRPRPGDRRPPRDPRGYDDPRDRQRRSFDDTFELTPTLGYRWGGTIHSETNTLFPFDTQLESSPSLGLTFGIPIGRTGMKFELMANQQATDLELGDGLFSPDEDIAGIDIHHYHLGIQVPLGRTPYVTPYVVASAGLATLDLDLPGVGNEARFSASAGIGLKMPVSDHIGFRFETRGFFTATDDEDDDCRRCYDDSGRDLLQGEASLGLVISF